MKSIRIQTIARAQKNQKEENALDIISKPAQLRCQKITAIEKVYREKFGFTIGYSIGIKSSRKKSNLYEILKTDQD